MDIVESTRGYEHWLRDHTKVVRDDLDAKHDAMDESPFVFLRATFYRWTEVWPSVCPKAADAPQIVAVGDLHLENFGTWRDAEGRLVWGVNDFDEAYPLPYTNDLVRLATSALLAAKYGELRISARSASVAILDGYRDGMEHGGRPVVLAERNRWLRGIAVEQLRNPSKFWKELSANKTARASIPPAVLRLLLPAPHLPHRVVARQAGVGSLGRPRFVVLLTWTGGAIAREIKALVPSAAVRVHADRSNRIYGADVAQRAVRSADPYFRLADRWIVRRLAPDCTKIEVGDLPRARDAAKLLRAMGWETANVHLGTRNARVLQDLAKRPKRWLERAAADMADATIADWRAWKRRSAREDRT